jgi:Icc-related predicted phosphoesterase
VKEAKIVMLSDTHTHHAKLKVPDGDFLVFAGDLMSCGRRFNEVMSFGKWFSAQPHKHKILVVGNHDRLFETNPTLCMSEFSKDVHYLVNESVEIDGFKFWGSPVQPWFHNWAFNVHRGAPIKVYWDKIPDNLDVLITHGPPYSILDQMEPGGEWGTDYLGCEELLLAVQRTKPKVHVFGHIHGSYGTVTHGSTQFINASICNEQYVPVNEPQVVTIRKE